MAIKKTEAEVRACKKWRENNKDKLRAQAYSWFDRNIEKRLLSNAKYSAKLRGLDFSITKEDIIIPEYCPYLGCKLTLKSGKGKLKTNVSIDRIDNSLGYIHGNIQIISNLANRMKADATEKELISFAENVLKIHKKIDNDVKE